MRKAWQLLPIYDCGTMLKNDFQEARVRMRRAWRWQRRGKPTVSGWSSGLWREMFSLNDFHPVIRFIPFVGTAVCAAPWKTTALLRLKISWKEEARNVQLFQIPNKFLWFQASLTTSCWRQQGWLILLPLLPCSGLTKSWALRCGKHLFLVTFPRPINNHYWQRVGRSGVESIIVMSPCLQRFTWMVWSLWSTPRTV